MRQAPAKAHTLETRLPARPSTKPSAHPQAALETFTLGSFVSQHWHEVGFDWPFGTGAQCTAAVFPELRGRAPLTMPVDCPVELNHPTRAAYSIETFEWADCAAQSQLQLNSPGRVQATDLI